ncbi:hypothetical protein LOTGIDRAFT_233620 [Lottia gigantea]|uniref:Coiled-coil domain-containing protein 15 n=1 Tax=Lottia gigantea TaxID=225164 RepID=V4ABB9_LOTGI|nr:hypothetical protein LOTGIDRAFT_233620 [Lottia gigantea]ESO90601.1 hypothetical protein LOTGIDRAFT_233620 [Lottia gigantea]
MASKLKYESLPVGLKKISRPVISSDIMGNRNVEIRPVGAWVQPAPTDRYSENPDAVTAAEEIEQQMNDIQKQKERRIRQFHEDVKKRVKTIERLKKQQQMEQNIQAVEEERNILQQSAMIKNYKNSRSSSQRKTGTSVHNTETHSIYRSSSHKHRKGSSKSKEDHIQTKVFTDQTSQIHQYTNDARKKLGLKKTDDYIEENDAGALSWHKPLHSFEEDKHPLDCLGLTILTHDHKQIPEIDWERQSVEEPDTDECEDDSSKTRPKKSVHFQVSPRVKGNRLKVKHSVKIPAIYNGVEEEEEKKRKRSQLALYRKLFMDIEREQVKENLRKRDHKRKIQLLKKEKELERKEEEEEALRLVEPRDPITGETRAEIYLREKMEESQIKETLEHHEHQRQKIKETQRYLEALQHNIRIKLEKKGIVLPPLCCCAETAWDTNPDTCANNCIFYKNPKAYTKALQSLLVSCQVG